MFNELLCTPSQTRPASVFPLSVNALTIFPVSQARSPGDTPHFSLPHPSHMLLRQTLCLPPPKYILSASFPLCCHCPYLTTVDNFLNGHPIFILDNFYLILYTML